MHGYIAICCYTSISCEDLYKYPMGRPWTLYLLSIHTQISYNYVRDAMSSNNSMTVNVNKLNGDWVIYMATIAITHKRTGGTHICIESATYKYTLRFLCCFACFTKKRNIIVNYLIIFAANSTRCKSIYISFPSHSSTPESSQIMQKPLSSKNNKPLTR